MFSFINLKKSYSSKKGGKLLFENISYTFLDKGFYALLGESGSGKSTLLNLLALLEKPDSGQIFYNEKEISSLSSKEKEAFRREYCGFLYQEHYLLPNLLVEENVALPLLINGAKKDEALQKSKKLLKDFNLGELIGKKTALCSGGEKSRLAFLRAIIKNPPILFADEPTGSLDHRNAVFIMEKLKEYGKNHLVIMVSHDEILSKEYCSTLLYLNSLKIAVMKNSLTKDKHYSFAKKKWPNGLFSLFSKKLYKEEKGKHILAIISSTLLFLSLIMFVGFIEGGDRFLFDGEDRSILYLSASLSKKIEVPIEGSKMNLSRFIRPAKIEAEALFKNYKSVHLENDYSFFFPLSLPYLDKGYTKEEAYFSPIWDITLKNRKRDFLLEGSLPKGDTFRYILINETLAKKIEKPIGNVIKVSSEGSFLKEKEKDSFALSFEFEIIGIVKDFAFLSLPRAFYSFPSFEREMKIRETEKGQNIFSLVNEALGEEEISSFSYNLFYEEEDAKEIKRKFVNDNNGYHLENPLWTSLASFSSLWESIRYILLPFLLAQSVISLFIIGLLVFSSFIKFRPYVSLLLALGLDNNFSSFIFLIESSLDIFISLLLAFSLSKPIEKLLSSLMLKKFALEDLIVIPFSSFLNIPFLLPILGFLIAIFILLISSFLPLKIESKKSLALELKRE